MTNATPTVSRNDKPIDRLAMYADAVRCTYWPKIAIVSAPISGKNKMSGAAERKKFSISLS